MSLEKKAQLIEDGYCLFENVLDAGMIDRVRKTSARMLDEQEAEHFEDNISTGSMICVWDDPFFAELINWQSALDALRSMGYDRPTFSTGFIISKPSHSPPLFWHQDWWGWDHEHSYSNEPQQLFLMYYLVDTTPQNGCLRLIPGSHIKRHEMHDMVPIAHTDEIRRAGDLSNPVFLDQPGEIDVCVKAGDLVIGDSRLLHSARANKTDDRRTVITLWYHPLFHELPEPMQAHLGMGAAGLQRSIDWPAGVMECIHHLWCTYEGHCEPLNSNRTPGPMLV